MQACVYEEYGPAEVVRLAEVRTPEARADEVLVRVHATAVTTADWRFRTSTFPRVFWLAGRLMIGLFRPRNPVLGMDFSGVVEAVGSDVTRFRVGDRVFGATRPMRRGAHAEYVAIRETDAIVHKPDSLTHAEAAAMPFGASCALSFLRDFAAVRPGQRVLVVGASGSVGVWAVQIARHLGADVTAVCSGDNADLVRSLGAHRVIDYNERPLIEAGEVYDLVFDTVGATSFAGCKDALAEKGVYLPLESGLRELLQALFTAFGSGKRVKHAISDNTREGLEAVLRLVEANALRPVVDSIYPMARIADAHRRVEGRHKRGTVVVAVHDVE